MILLINVTSINLYILKILFIERGEGREKERKRNINVWVPFMHPLLGTWPTTQACALTRNQTCDLLVHSLTRPTEPHQPGPSDSLSASYSADVPILEHNGSDTILVACGLPGAQRWNCLSFSWSQGASGHTFQSLKQQLSTCINHQSC